MGVEVGCNVAGAAVLFGMTQMAAMYGSYTYHLHFDLEGDARALCRSNQPGKSRHGHCILFTFYFGRRNKTFKCSYPRASFAHALAPGARPGPPVHPHVPGVRSVLRVPRRMVHQLQRSVRCVCSMASRLHAACHTLPPACCHAFPAHGQHCHYARTSSTSLQLHLN